METELTLEKCKQIHHDMWKCVKKFDSYSGQYDRSVIKAVFCNKYNLDLLNHCALCEYARQHCIQNNESYKDGSLCKYCPAIWGTEDKVRTYYCELAGGVYNGEDVLNWIESSCDDIINIKWKDEIE